tara:strand:- start:233 stop:814 length:582 start_codon:yes stop_codon:yes gene_type:complete
MKTLKDIHCHAPQANGQIKFILSIALALFLACGMLMGCSGKKSILEVPVAPRFHACQEFPFVEFSITQQDALPGIESNVRKQRTYRVEVEIPADDGDGWLNVVESLNEWELWVDSVRVPMRFRPLRADMHAIYSGSRIFYGSSRSGSMKLPEEEYMHHGTELNGEARLVGYNSMVCYTHSIDSIIRLPLIVAP